MTARLTADARQLVKAARDAEARQRVKREKKLGLPDGIDRTLYCAQGKHLRAIHERTRSDRKKECGGCKAEKDAARSVSKATCWWPALPARLVASTGLLSEFGEDHPGIPEGDQWDT
jgi:hypothetical protein